MSTQSKPLPQLTPFAAALAGALGGCFSTAVVYPLDVAKTRIQVSKRAQKSMLKVLLDVFMNEGIFGLYRGFAATMVNTFSQQYAYFFFYSFVRNSYSKRLASKYPVGAVVPALSTAAELLIGALAGALAQIFTIPVSVIATRQQVGRSVTSRSSPPPLTQDSEEAPDDSFIGVAKEIIDEEGITGLWLGIKPGLVLTVNPAITYGVFERIKAILLLARTQAGLPARLTPLLTFLVGATSKTLATVVTYPYIMAKVRIQARSADSEDAEARNSGLPQTHKYHHADHSKHVGAIQILSRVWKREGIVGWYQGMQAQITKAVLSQALLFLSKEQFERWAITILLLIGRL